MITPESHTEAAVPEHVVIDELSFDELTGKDPETGLSGLDAIRERYKGRISDIFLSHQHLSDEAKEHNARLPRHGYSIAQAGAFMVAVVGFELGSHRSKDPTID